MSLLYKVLLLSVPAVEHSQSLVGNVNTHNPKWD